MKIDKPSNQLLKIIRKEKLLTQQQVADLLFVCKPTYASWESDYGKIPTEKLCKLFEILGVKKSVAYPFLFPNFKDEITEETKTSFEKECLIEILNRLDQIERHIRVIK